MIDFRFISIIKLIKHFTFAVNQENCEINLWVRRVLTDYNKNLSRATDKDGINFFFFLEKELVTMVMIKFMYIEKCWFNNRIKEPHIFL